MFLLRSVCLFVCLFVCLSFRRINEKVLNGFWRNFLKGRAWPKNQGDKFWWRSGSPSGSRSPKSEIRIHWIIEKVSSGLRSKLHNLHCKNHSAILLCWRSAEVCAFWALLVDVYFSAQCTCSFLGGENFTYKHGRYKREQNLQTQDSWTKSTQHAYKYEGCKNASKFLVVTKVTNHWQTDGRTDER